MIKDSLHFHDELGDWDSIGWRMDKVRIVDERVTDEFERVVGDRSPHTKSKPLCFQHINDGDADNQPDSWARSVALSNALEGYLDTLISRGRIAVRGPDVVFHLIKCADHDVASLLGEA